MSSPKEKRARMSASSLEFLFLFEPLNGEPDESIDEFGIRDAACFPEFRVHADFCEAGNGVYLVDVQLPFLGEEKIHASHAFAGERSERADRKLLNLFCDARRNACGDFEPRAVRVEIFRFI